jgi:hypothetical protein
LARRLVLPLSMRWEDRLDVMHGVGRTRLKESPQAFPRWAKACST